MNRPYRIRVSIENADHGKMDRTEMHLPSMEGATSQEVAAAVAAKFDSDMTIQEKTPQSEHDRLVAAQNKEKNAGTNPK